ncbi:MAG: c-type cytochrome [Actinomycetia bacterium]|nr:c-type cytochrome [Actinomycetes bacterium]
MTFLLARRRSPWATALLLFLALIAVGGMYAVASGSMRAEATTPTASTTQIEEGRELFLVGCSTCHGLNADGAFQPDGTIAGPTLIGVGAASVNFNVSTGRMPLAAPGAQAKRKPPIYSDEETAALAAYIASLAPGPEIPTPDMYDTTGITPEEIALGGQLFRANCASCHNFAGEGGTLTDGKYAPSLTETEPRNVYQAMLLGPQNMPNFPDTTLRQEDKRAIIGYIEALRETPNSGGIDAGRLGPVTEGIVVWTVGLGALIAVAIWIGVKAK